MIKNEYIYGLSILGTDVIKNKGIDSIIFKHHLDGWQMTFSIKKGESKYWVSIINHEISNGLEAYIEKDGKEDEHLNHASEGQVIKVLEYLTN